MRKTTKTVQVPQTKVTLGVMPLKSKFSDASVGVSVDVRVTGADAAKVESETLAVAHEVAAKILRLGIRIATPNVEHVDSYRNNTVFTLEFVSRATVQCEAAHFEFVSRLVKETREVCNVA